MDQVNRYFDRIRRHLYRNSVWGNGLQRCDQLYEGELTEERSERIC